MIKINQFVSPSSSNVWCVTLEWMDEKGLPHFHSEECPIRINNILSIEALDALKKTTGQNIAMIINSEDPN